MQTLNPMYTKFSIAKFKEVKEMSEETMAMTADILMDGTVIGRATNDGHGECNRYYFNDRGCEFNTAFEVAAKECGLEVDCFFARLINAFDIKKTLTRWAKSKNTYVKMEGAGRSWATYKVPYSPEVKAKINPSDGRVIAYFLNEEFDRAVNEEIAYTMAELDAAK